MNEDEALTTAHAVQNADALLAACAALRKELKEYERQVRRMRTRVRKGRPNPVPQVVPELIAVRARFDERFSELERCRRRWRTAYFQLQADAGMSYGEIAREWGFSRQLVSRLMNDTPEPTEPARDSNASI